MSRTHHIDLWFWPLLPVAPAAEVLSADERARAARFVREADAQAWIAARSGLRRILGSYLAARPDQIEFDYGPYGRPSLKDAEDLSFNLSHSGGYAALAVSEQLCLGLDIEAPRKIEREVARYAFSAAEQAELGSLDVVDWHAGFYNCWTRKEAVVKAEGTGLSAKLDAFDVTLRPGAPAKLTRIELGQASDWTLADLALPAGLVGALAAKTYGAAINIVPRYGDPQ